MTTTGLGMSEEQPQGGDGEREGRYRAAGYCVV